MVSPTSVLVTFGPEAQPETIMRMINADATDTLRLIGISWYLKAMDVHFDMVAGRKTSSYF
jgi:hypothetical protein